MNYYSKNNRKEIVLVALLVAIVGMSLGFAAFSNTLSISSSATVTPNSDDFSVVFSGSATTANEFNSFNASINAGAELLSEPFEFNSGSFTGPTVNFTSTGAEAEFTFYAHNIGEYDAYLNSISYTPLSNGTYKACSSTTTDETKATDSLVQAACDGINVTISIGGTSYTFGSNISGHKLSKGSVEEVSVKIEYVTGSALADGPFKVDISDFKLNYSTVDSTS